MRSAGSRKPISRAVEAFACDCCVVDAYKGAFNVTLDFLQCFSVSWYARRFMLRTISTIAVPCFHCICGIVVAPSPWGLTGFKCLTLPSERSFLRTTIGRVGGAFDMRSSCGGSLQTAWQSKAYGLQFAR